MTTFIYQDEELNVPPGNWDQMSKQEAYVLLEEISQSIYTADDEEWEPMNNTDGEPMAPFEIKLVRKYGFESAVQLSSFKDYMAEAAAEESGEDITSFYTRVAMEQMNRNMARQTVNAGDNGLLDPISGVSLETYAHISARLAQGENMAELLKQYGVETVTWDEASAGWTERMRTDTTYVLVNEYGKYFMSAGQGQFGDTAKDVSQTMNFDGAKVATGEPLSLEKYVEIMSAQNAAVAQGKDANAVLAGYGLNAADWGTVGGYWTNKMMTDMNIGIRFGELLAKYEAQFAAQTPSASADIDF